MRIIDKQTDFYDYIQHIYQDDSVVFDRTDSFVLTKNELCQHFPDFKHYYDYRYAYKYSKTYKHHRFVLLQIGSVYWLFLADIIKLDPDYKAEDYNLELIAYWKNYNKPRVLIKMDIIGFDYHVRNQLYVDNRSWVMGYDRQKITDKADMLTKVIDMNDYRTLDTIDRCVVMQGYNRVEKHIPLLKECGISTCVDPMDVYMAFDEYFSMEKTASERSDAKGTTNNDKIINHGFDTKVSFRGKVTTMKGKDK